MTARQVVFGASSWPYGLRIDSLRAISELVPDFVGRWAASKRAGFGCDVVCVGFTPESTEEGPVRLEA